MSDPAPLNFSDLPRPWLAQLIQHAASGPRGSASAAALSQTCSSLHALSESSAVTYRNIHVPQTISSPDHSFWQWLAKREGHVVGLTLRVEHNGPAARENWESPIQHLAAVPDVQLTVAAPESNHASHSFVTQWLSQHSHSIGHFIVKTRLHSRSVNSRYPSDETWSLQEFVTAAAPCKSLSVALLGLHEDLPLDFSCVAEVAHSLVSLDCSFDQLTGITALTSLTRLSELCLAGYSPVEEPWVSLASLTGLSRLSLVIVTHGDPSPLSALTGLRSLSVGRRSYPPHGGPPFTFSSLQPLSTMLQLECLNLFQCCAASSLEGLSGLPSLRDLGISGSEELSSLEGLSTSLTSLQLDFLGGLTSMAGVGAAVGLQHLSIRCCNLTSLQSLASLKCLATLVISEYSMGR